MVYVISVIIICTGTVRIKYNYNRKCIKIYRESFNDKKQKTIIFELILFMRNVYR